MVRSYLKIYVFLVLASPCALQFQSEVIPACAPDKEICEFYFDISYMETMVYYDPEANYRNTMPVFLQNGTLKKRNRRCTEYNALTQKELESVLTVDGSSKLLFVVNHQFPGTPIYVYSNQTVVVTVKNNLLHEGVTIHWHGMRQLNTPWMDGTSMVNQCPITPNSFFQYRFKAEPEGTHFYHSHHGTQRTDGLFGPLVVLPKPDKVRTDIPEVDKDYVMTLTEWNREHSSLELALLRTAKTERIGLDPNSSVCFLSTHGPDGTAMGTIPFHSALINGKGHYFPDRGDIPLIPVLPLETFKVKQGKFYRFRIINAGQIYPFRVSIDQHRIAVIATDGFDTEPEVAESVIIGNGERFDILVHADQPVDNYWVRVETLERTRDDVPMKPGKSFAILRYDGAPNERPSSRREECTRQRHCKIINCPFRQFAKTEYQDCTHVTDLHSTKDTMGRFPTPVRTDNSHVEETFLNFHFAGYGRNPIGPVLSGRRFKLPTCPPQVTENPDTCIDDCNAKDCTDWCHCTNIKVLKLDQANQFVLVNDGNLRSGMIHSVHLHGHSFHVVKVGYPSVDPDTGIITEPTKDFKCNGVSCQYPVWSDPAWKNGDISGLNIRNPPIKDTIFVPRKGYVIIRFTSNNPGYWFMHCHMEKHNIKGMAVIIKTGDDSIHPAPPQNIPRCGNFQFSNEEFERLRLSKNDILVTNGNSDGSSKFTGRPAPRSYSTDRGESDSVLQISVIGASLFVTSVIALALIIGAIKYSCMKRQPIGIATENIKYGTLRDS